MTKPRPISSVHVDIARLIFEVSKVSSLSEDSKESMEKLGRWTSRLVECLATRNPDFHVYGAYLLAEVDEFRKGDSERKKRKYSVDSLESVDSPESPPRSDQIRSDQSNKEKNKIKRASPFMPPPLDQVSAYCLERENGIDPEQFIAHYDSNGWKVGSNKMTSWKAAVITWEKREKGRNHGVNGKHSQQFKSAQEKREDSYRAAIATIKRPGECDPGVDYQDVHVMPQGRSIAGDPGLRG